MSDLPGNQFTAAKNSHGVEFKIGDSVTHEGGGDEVAVIEGFALSERHAPEIEAFTSRGRAHLDYLSLA